MKDNKKHRIYWAIILFLIVLLLILLYFTKFGKIQNILIPTGNVDVFDIDIDCDCDKDDIDNPNDIENPVTNNSNNSNNQKKNKKRSTSKECVITTKDGTKEEIPTYNEDEAEEQGEEELLGKVFVDDKSGDYVYHQRLEIFENAAFHYTTKIAPGVSNTYHFVVHNSTEYKLKYNLEMLESTEYFINLKYRLKRNNQYVIGDDNNWVPANELKLYDLKINSGVSDSYSLDWQWVYEDGVDDQDLIAGENMRSAYKLNAKFYFESVD